MFSDHATPDTRWAQVFGMLDHHHTIGSLGNRRPRHDLRTLVTPQQLLGEGPGRNRLHHFKIMAEVSAAADEAVPGGLAERGQIDIRDNVFRQNTMKSLQQTNALGADPMG
jgi:hypothetical protein